MIRHGGQALVLPQKLDRNQPLAPAATLKRWLDGSSRLFRSIGEAQIGRGTRWSPLALRCSYIRHRIQRQQTPLSSTSAALYQELLTAHSFESGNGFSLQQSCGVIRACKRRDATTRQNMGNLIVTAAAASGCTGLLGAFGGT
jgi:hypothetical protein